MHALVRVDICGCRFNWRVVVFVLFVCVLNSHQQKIHPPSLLYAPSKIVKKILNQF